MFKKVIQFFKLTNTSIYRRDLC